MNPPIFIIGSPRSGTTLLRLMVTCHQNIVVPPECGFAVWWYTKYKVWTSPDNSQLAPFVADVMASKKIETWKLNPEKLLEFFCERVPKNYATAVSAVYEFYGRSLGRTFSRWGDKNNFYISHITTLNEMFPECHFVQIVRDGRDVACSYRELHRRAIHSPYAPSLPFDIAEIAEQWRDNLETTAGQLDLLPSERVHHVRFEDLVRDPESTLRRLCHALGEAFDPRMLEYSKLNQQQKLEPSEFLQWKERTLSPPDLDAVGRFRSELNGPEIKAFEEIAGPVLRRNAYI